MKLTIELVPSKSWYKNVRSNVSDNEWNLIRKKCYKNANYKCEICGDKGKEHPVECHEIWEYNDDNKTQILKGLISLCPTCHKVKHAGLSISKGEIKLVIKQLMKVNGITSYEADEYIVESFKKWDERSKYDWDLDISYLDYYKKIK